MSGDARYLALWRRMNRLVERYTAAQRLAEADALMAEFFMCFDDPDELESHVEIAERAALEPALLPER